MTGVAKAAVAGGSGLRNGLHSLAAFIRYVVARFISDGCLTAAAALTYTTLVSLVPLIAIAFAVLSAFPIFADMRDQLVAQLFARFVLRSAPSWITGSAISPAARSRPPRSAFSRSRSRWC